MMRIEDRLLRLVDALPDGASVILPVSLVRQWLEDEGMVTEEPAPNEDDGRLPAVGLTVNQVAEHVDRDTSTVRGWLAQDRFPNARKLGREWRVPVGDLAAFLHGDDAADPEPESSVRKPPELTGGGDLDSWEEHRG